MTSHNSSITDDDKVTIRNTFINVVPAAPLALRHSRSESDISSCTTSTQSSESEAASWRQQQRHAQGCLILNPHPEDASSSNAHKGSSGGHKVWGTISNSGSSFATPSSGSERRGKQPWKKLPEGIDVCEQSSSANGMSSEDDQVEPERPAVEQRAQNWVISRGSALHGSGQCSPCNYFVKARGCTLGAECDFCHLDHSGTMKSRPGKIRRAKFKRVAESAQMAFQDQPELLEQSMDRLAQKGDYMRSLVDARRQNGHQPNQGTTVLTERRLGELHRALNINSSNSSNSRFSL